MLQLMKTSHFLARATKYASRLSCGDWSDPVAIGLYIYMTLHFYMTRAFLYEPWWIVFSGPFQDFYLQDLDRICRWGVRRVWECRSRSEAPQRIGPKCIFCYLTFSLEITGVFNSIKRKGQSNHAASVVAKSNATCIHQPAIGITQTVRTKSRGLLPGCWHVT